MKYVIEADASEWPKEISTGNNSLPYYAYADCFGRLEIVFSYDGRDSIYQNDFVNIPLFLTEMNYFLNRIHIGVQQDWYLGFAPFAYGLLSGGSLLISSRTGKAFFDGVYDATAQNDLARLKTRVAKDISKFGKVQMTE